MVDRDPFAGPPRRSPAEHLRGPDGFLSAADEIAYVNDLERDDTPTGDVDPGMSGGGRTMEAQVEGAVASSEPIRSRPKAEEPSRAGRARISAEPRPRNPSGQGRGALSETSDHSRGRTPLPPSSRAAEST